MNPIKIAIVDDHVLFRAGIGQILNAQEDMKVIIESGNGKEFIDALEDVQPDVVLMDLEMPVMDGHATLVELKKKSLDIKVIMLTMHKHDSFIVKMMELGAVGYLLKDAEPDEVMKAIRSVDNDGLYFNSRVSKALLGSLAGTNIDTSMNSPIGEPLTKREIEVLELICEELTTAQIADRIFLSPKTVEGYRKSLLEKTGSTNVAGLAIYAVRNRLV